MLSCIPYALPIVSFPFSILYLILKSLSSVATCVKTLNLEVEYMFHLCQHLISLCSSTEDPVKVFSEVILQVRVLRLLVTLCTIVQGLKRVWDCKSRSFYIMSQTSFSHIFINSSIILTVLMAIESP